MSASAESRRPIPFSVYFVAAFAAGCIGSWATLKSSHTWYPLLLKPAWSPPNSLFGPVWTVLYVLMAVAAWRVGQTGAAGTRPLIVAYFVQLVFNALWSALFFGLHRPLWALVDLVILLGLLFRLQMGFARADRVAGLLWLPYLLWVSFAGVLNLAIVRLN
jgi:tryptophan-rich sensory protein